MQFGSVHRSPPSDWGVNAAGNYYQGVPSPEAITFAPRPDGSILAPYGTPPEAPSVRDMAHLNPNSTHHHIPSHHGHGPVHVPPHMMNTTSPKKAKKSSHGMEVVAVAGVAMLGLYLISRK